MNKPETLANSRLNTLIPPIGDRGLQGRYAEHAADLETKLNRTIASAAAVGPTVTVVGLTVSGGGGSTMFGGFVSFGVSVTPDGPHEIPAANARVFCEESAQSDSALSRAASRLWDRIAATNPQAQVYQAQIAVGGASPKYLLAVLAYLPPPQ